MLRRVPTKSHCSRLIHTTSDIDPDAIHANLSGRVFDLIEVIAVGGNPVRIADWWGNVELCMKTGLPLMCLSRMAAGITTKSDSQSPMSPSSLSHESGMHGVVLEILDNVHQDRLHHERFSGNNHGQLGIPLGRSYPVWLRSQERGRRPEAAGEARCRQPVEGAAVEDAIAAHDGFLLRPGPIHSGRKYPHPPLRGTFSQREKAE